MEGVQNVGRYACSQRRRAGCGRRHEPCGGADFVRFLSPGFTGKAAGAAVKRFTAILQNILVEHAIIIIGQK